MPKAQDRPKFLDNDEWMEKCMGNPDDIISEEWNIKTHWKIILTGTRGAGMFNHSDSLLTSSWHAQVLGRKWWYVCGHHGAEIFPDGQGKQACYEGILQVGEILYYPRHWHHETQCLDTPTMTLTDTVAKASNAEGIMMKAFGECSGKEALNFDFSAKLCDALSKCSKWWKEKATAAGKPWKVFTIDFDQWRTMADKDHIVKVEKTDPSHSNYDGRNYITEL